MSTKLIPLQPFNICTTKLTIISNIKKLKNQHINLFLQFYRAFTPLYVSFNSGKRCKIWKESFNSDEQLFHQHQQNQPLNELRFKIFYNWNNSQKPFQTQATLFL